MSLAPAECSREQRRGGARRRWRNVHATPLKLGGRAATYAAPVDVVVDCDPGVDDALALLALAGLRTTGTVRVTAVTAVAGNAPVEVTARNAAHVVANSSLEGVPVLAGPPRTATLREDHHGPDGLGGFGPAAGAPRGAAVPDTAVDTLASRLAEGAVILALGPLTNVAAAVQRLSGGVGPGARVVVMGGGPDGEFNFAFDRQAAAAVLSSGVPVTQVPIEVTRKVLFTVEDAAVLPRSGKPAPRPSMTP